MHAGSGTYLQYRFRSNQKWIPIFPGLPFVCSAGYSVGLLQNQQILPDYA
jgi:hypothetical protein